MAIDLVESGKLTTDALLQGVIETIVQESDVLSKLPFIDIVGNGLTYNQESTLPTAGFYGPNDEWNEDTPKFTQATAVLSILGGDADVDEFLRQTRSNVQNLKSTVIEQKSKAVARKFDYTFIYGNNSTDTKSFNGLHNLFAATPSAPDQASVAQAAHAGSGSTGAALSIKAFRAMIDMVKPGKPDFLIMNRTMRNLFSAYAERTSSPVRYDIGALGKRVMTWDDIPILINDWIFFTETISGSAWALPTTGATTSIFAVKFGEKNVCGLQNGGIQVKDLGDLETKDATRTRIKWYCSLACFNMLSLALIDGITNADITS
jgi:hypothetical protein